MEAEDVDVGRGELARAAQGPVSASTPNCWGPPPIRMPEPLTRKSGLTRTATRGRIPRRSPIATTRCGLVRRLDLDVTPGGDRLAELGVGLARPGEADPVGRDPGVQRDPQLAGRRDVEAVDERREMLDDRGHRVGLHRVPDRDPRAERRAHLGDPLGDSARS